MENDKTLDVTLNQSIAAGFIVKYCDTLAIVYDQFYDENAKEYKYPVFTKKPFYQIMEEFDEDLYTKMDEIGGKPVLFLSKEKLGDVAVAVMHTNFIVVYRT